VAAAPEDVERFVALSAVVAVNGGRILLCVPDGSAAGAAAKRAGKRLERCVVVGMPDDPVQVRLLLRKFRPTRMVSFRESAGAPVVKRAVAAAGAAGLQTMAVSREDSDGAVLT
jgi:hypothetical protein